MTDSMDSAVVRRLFEALASAQKQPTSFEIETRNANGAGGYTVLVIPVGLYDAAIKPVLKAMKYDVKEL